MSKLETFYYPETIEEAIELLSEESRKSAVIAGGSTLSLVKDPTIEALVDLTRAGMNYIRENNGGLVLGATTVIQDIFKSEACENYADGILSEAASTMASRPLRNVITVGGNLVASRVWSDLPPVLMAMDAIIKVKGVEEKEFSAEEFYQQRPVKLLQKNEVVTQVEFPPAGDKSGATFIKFSKTKGDYSIINVACYLELEENTCKKARIVASAAVNLPIRFKEAEAKLEGSEITAELIAEVAGMCSDEIEPLSNLWGTAEYKKKLTRNLVCRALSECLEKANNK
ncbi:MAG: FAD binding domain-containing protein [Vulcanimicrobiota bacterium]